MARKIETALVNFIDSKLKDNGLAQEILTTKDATRARTLMVLAAQACVGIRESGNNSGPMVKLIQETVGIAQGEAWCMSFVQSMIAYVEVKLGIKSPLKATEGCTDLWDSSNSNLKVKIQPNPGAVIIWRHDGTWRGHTGILYAYHSSQTSPATPYPSAMKADWISHLEKEVLDSGLCDLVPSDIDTFNKGYKAADRDERVRFWVHLISNTVRYESSFNPDATFKEGFDDSKGNPVISSGLLQVSVESASGYGFKVTQDEIMNPLINLSIGVAILKKWCIRDGVVSKGSTTRTARGAARYWSVMRPMSGTKPRTSYTSIRNSLLAVRLEPGASTSGNSFSAIEGNTTQGVEGGEIVREGGGVYDTRRAAKKIGSMNLSGYLIPFPGTR